MVKEARVTVSGEGNEWEVALEKFGGRNFLYQYV
jgi:hypothetical protein